MNPFLPTALLKLVERQNILLRPITRKPCFNFSRKQKKFLSLGLEQTLFLQTSFFEEQLLNLAATFLKRDAVER